MRFKNAKYVHVMMLYEIRRTISMMMIIYDDYEYITISEFQFIRNLLKLIITTTICLNVLKFCFSSFSHRIHESIYNHYPDHHVFLCPSLRLKILYKILRCSIFYFYQKVFDNRYEN